MEGPNPNHRGRVYTWGDDDFLFGGSGVLGIGDSAGDRDTPVCVLRGEQDYNDPGQVHLKHIVAISAGWDHLMALEKYEVYDPFLPNFDPNHKGRVYTWGSNGQGWGDGREKGEFHGFFVDLGEEMAELGRERSSRGNI